MIRWNVGIMGSGMMAQGFDSPGDKKILSMANAFTQLPKFRIGGFYDLDPQKAEEAEMKWGCPPTSRNRDDWLHNGWDVIYIATPDENHTSDLRDAIAHRPKAILVEKPLGTNIDEGLKLLHEAYQLGILLMVNYPRRWHSATLKVKELIHQGKIGNPVSAIFVISGGVIHNLPHILDIFHTWWDNEWQIYFNGRRGDSTYLTFSLNDVKLPVTIIDRSSTVYYVLEMHIYCSNGKIELSRSPEVLELFEIKPHSYYSTFEVLTPFFHADMEEEPLLLRTIEGLANAMEDPGEAEKLHYRELKSHQFMAKVFRFFQQDYQ